MPNQQNDSELILKIAHLAFNAHAVLVFLPDETGRLALTLSCGLEDSQLKGLRLEAGKGLAGWVLRNKQSVLINDFDANASHIGYYLPEIESKISAFMGCPISNGGIICVDANSKQFSENDLELLQIIAQLLSKNFVSVSQQLEDDSRKYFVRFERIQELHSLYPQWRQYLAQFLQLMAEASDFDHIAFVALKEENSPNFVIEAESHPLLLDANMPRELPLSGALVGWVFKNDVPVHTEGLDGVLTAPLYGKVKGIPQFQAVVCLPININKMTSAVLCFASQKPKPITQSLRSFLRMAAAELVKYLEGLYLRHKIRTLMSPTPQERR